MKVAIIGSGSIGRAYYAYLSAAKHDVALWSPSGAALVDFGKGSMLEVTGKINGVFPMHVKETADEAISGAAVIIVATPGNGFKAVSDALEECLQAGQHVIFSSHSSLAAMYLAMRVSKRRVAALISGWSTTVLTAQKTGLRSVHVSAMRQLVDVAAIPARNTAQAVTQSCSLFGNRFGARQNVLALTLNNLNPPAHAANMLGNMTRAERGETWPNYGGITPAVGAIIQRMDNERLTLARSFDLTVRTMQEHFTASFGVAKAEIFEMSQAVFALRPELNGPTSLKTRFITEDVPYGLYPLEWLGNMVGVRMPLHTAAIEIFSTACKKDFRAENALLDCFADALSDKRTIVGAVANGFA